MSQSEFLFSVIRATLDCRVNVVPALPIPPCVDWAMLVERALAHGVAAFLSRYILALPPEVVSSEFSAAAEHFLRRRRDDAAAAIGDLRQVLENLEAAGIAAVPFKGPLLANEAYGHWAAREFRDLDILIPETQAERAIHVLEGLGYCSQQHLSTQQRRAYYHYNGQDLLVGPGKYPLEPHWKLAPSTLSIRLDPSELLQRTRIVCLDHYRFRVLSPEDTLLVLGLHGSKEQWGRLVWIADVAGFVRNHPDLDWNALLGTAERAGIKRMVLLALELACTLGVQPPDEAMAAIRSDVICRQLARQLREQFANLTVEQSSVFHLCRFRWLMRERLSDRLRYAAATLTTPRVQHLRLFDSPPVMDWVLPIVKVSHDYLAKPIWLTGRKVLRNCRSK